MTATRHCHLQIAFDLTAKYPPTEPEPFAKGQVTPESAAAYCIDSHHGTQMDKLQLRKCTAATEKEFIFSWHKDVRSVHFNHIQTGDIKHTTVTHSGRWLVNLLVICRLLLYWCRPCDTSQSV